MRWNSTPALPPEFTGWAREKEDWEFLADGGDQNFYQCVDVEAYLGDDFVPVDPDWFQIRNQGPVGSCQGHSIAGCTEICYAAAAGEIDLDGDGQPYEAGKPDDRFSPQWGYIGSQRIDGIRGDRGSSISAGVKLATEKGMAREIVVPYPGRYTTSLPPEADADAADFQLTRHKQFRGAQAEPEARAWILSGQGPINIGIKWPPRFDDNYIIRRGGGGMGGHAIIVGGFIKHPTTGEPVYTFYNSHGANAQSGGKFYATPEGFAALLGASFTAAIGVSDMTVARPRAINWRKRGIW